MASRDAFYVWHFRTAQSWTTLRLDSSNKNPAQNANSKSSERLYHVDDAPGGMYSFFPVNFFTQPEIFEDLQQEFEFPTLFHWEFMALLANYIRIYVFKTTENRYSMVPHMYM